MTTLWLDPAPLVLSPAWGIPFDLAVAIAIACSVLAIAATSTTERQRAAWSLLPIAILFALYGTYGALVVLQTDYGVATELAIGLNLAYVVVPIVLTYVALSRRMIDIGFVLNKATVFAIVSGFVIGVFILIEWAANDWLTHESHTTSAIVGMVIALGLGLSMRYIHGAADHLVDRVFFRKRHEDEKALRGFAHEASFITDPQVLLDRAAGEVKEHTSADNVAIYVSNGAPNYTASNGSRRVVGENDPGIVALRAWGKPIHLHDLSASELHGELAFPMISRGRLVGTLVCGPKARRRGLRTRRIRCARRTRARRRHNVRHAFERSSRRRSGDGREARLDSGEADGARRPKRRNRCGASRWCRLSFGLFWLQR